MPPCKGSDKATKHFAGDIGYAARHCWASRCFFTTAAASSQEFPATSDHAGGWLWRSGGELRYQCPSSGEVISRNLNVPVVVENKTGAGGAVAAPIAACGLDGHTPLGDVEVAACLYSRSVSRSRNTIRIKGYTPVGTILRT